MGSEGFKGFDYRTETYQPDEFDPTGNLANPELALALGVIKRNNLTKYNGQKFAETPFLPESLYNEDTQLTLIRGGARKTAKTATSNGDFLG